jgi:PPP family 3-phenylpropionic acid transporter
MSPRFNLAIRLASLHGSLSAVTGAQTPLWPLFLAWKGLDPFEIGLVLSAAYIVKIVSNPIAGYVSDRLGERRLPLVVLAAVAFVSFIPFAFVDGFSSLLALTLLAAGAFTALTPLGDNLTLHAISGQRIQYGHVRVWGSLTFMVFSGLASKFLIGRPPILILFTVLGTLALTVFACWRLPRIRTVRPKGRQQPIGALLKNPVFLLFLATATLNLSSNTALYGFATLHWQSAGLSGGMIGALWAEMVAAEAIVFSFGHRIATRLGPRWLLVAGALGGVVRWTVTGIATDPVALASVQWMHCLTFTATHLGAMYFIQRSIPAELSGRAQAIYSACSSGLNYGIFMPITGLLYEQWGGGDAFLAMTGLSVIGLVLAAWFLRRWTGGPLFAAEGAAT